MMQKLLHFANLLKINGRELYLDNHTKNVIQTLIANYNIFS